MTQRNRAGRSTAFLLLLALFCLAGPGLCRGETSRAAVFTDDAGRQGCSRVLLLVPAITEILFAIGAGEAVAGLTYHDTLPPQASTRPIVGGFLAPSLPRIRLLRPDVVFYARLQEKHLKALALPHTRLVCLEPDSIGDSYRVIRQLGRLFNHRAAAAEVIARYRAQLELIARKVARIPPASRLRVMRLMGRERVMTPGDDSLQNEMIRAAGGIPPVLGKTGRIVPVAPEEFRRFNPQVIYGCGADRTAALELLQREGWREVDTVRNRRLLTFPCDLTSRVAAHTGDFVSWLSARIYRSEFRRPRNYLLKERILSSASLEIELPWVIRARVVTSRIADFEHKTLLVDFKAPMSVVSTLEGTRSGISTVGNHYMPPQYWGFGRLADIRRDVLRTLDLRAGNTALLITGVDMDHLVLRRAVFRDLAVTALVTAGVHGNAMRSSRDAGTFYEPGTINILLLTNSRLTPRAMTRALIAATEAKTAALQDLDIRSSYQPRRFAATGTGTDNIIVAQGRCVTIDNTGGHSRMGQLIATAVHDAVMEAVFRQNGLTASRNIFQRLRERRIDLYGLARAAACEGATDDIARALQLALLAPETAAFLETAFALSDAQQAGRLRELSGFRSRCLSVAGGIAAKPLLLLDEEWPRCCLWPSMPC